MENVDPTARAGPSRRNRPLSRASTTSMRSTATHQGLDPIAFGEMPWHAAHLGQRAHQQIQQNNHQQQHQQHQQPLTPHLQPLQQQQQNNYQPQPHIHHSHQLQHQSHHQQQQPSPDDMMMQAAQLHQPQHGAITNFGMDPGMAGVVVHPLGYSRTSLPDVSFTDGGSSIMKCDDNDEGDSGIVVAEPTKPASRSSANNELEMRSLFQQNKHRALHDVAGELQGNERGAHSERSRQVFAMLWVNQACSDGKGSVPRGRVYASYAYRCSMEKVTVLNPASFGKLVRVIFPGLKTRRLGVRGESKYHYVNFAMMEDGPDRATKRSMGPLGPPAPRPILPETDKPLNYILPAPSQQPLAAQLSTSAETAQQPAASPSTLVGTRICDGGKSHSMYKIPDPVRGDSLDATSAKTELGLCLLDNDDGRYSGEPVALPAIEPFLPPGTDPDAAKALMALYRSHCTSLVECIRYCKEKNFFHLYMSFQGTLTQPVQRLFSHPSMATWIEESDCALYQRMLSIISGLTLQVLPVPVLDTLRSISSRLVDHIRQSFHGQPKHVVDAKEAPAVLFAGLIDRTLRVNLTAHAAANMLANPDNRKEMYTDWLAFVRIRKVAEVVPTCGMDDVVKLLVNEIRHILEPGEVPWDVEGMTIYADVPIRDNDTAPGSHGGHNVLDRWMALLKDLPNRFPYATHADIVWCVERVGTAVMRDITIAGGNSFGAWWVTKVWIDEMVWFLAEKGAFMRLKTTRSQAPVSATATAAVAKTQPVPAAPGAGADGHSHAGVWAHVPPSASSVNFEPQPIGHQVQQPDSLQQLTTVNSSSVINLGSDCVPFGQSAPMPASAAPQNNNINSIDVNTSMSMNMSMSMNDEASVVDSAHDDSGIGSEHDFKLERLSMPRDHFEGMHQPNGI